jgi:aminoglycoside phosphotransferase (APT) family kinase protein
MSINPVDIGAALIAAIGGQTSAPPVVLDGPLQRLEGGFDTDTFLVSFASAPHDWPARGVLRLYQAGTPARRAKAEAAAQRVVAAQGIPSAGVLMQGDDLFAAGGDPTRPFMVMEFAPGGTLLSRGLRPSPFFFRMMAVMANLLADLHQLDPEPLRREFKSAGLDPHALGPDRRLDATRERLRGADAAGLLRGSEWLETQRPGEDVLQRSVICHGDFHPLNILVDQGRVSALIDWSNVSVAPAEYDLAILCLIARHGPLELLGPIRWVIDLFRGYLMRRFDAAYRAASPGTKISSATTRCIAPSWP